MNAAPHNVHMMGMTEMDNTPYYIVARSLADYLWGKKEMKQDKYPSFGFSVKDKEEQGYPIKRVLPETIAAENGLMTGDIIITIDGKEFKSLFDLKKHLQYKNWNEEISFQIKRGDEVKIISFTIEPVEEKS